MPHRLILVTALPLETIPVQLTIMYELRASTVYAVSLPGWTLLQTRILPAAFIFIIQMISWPSYKHGNWVLYVDAQDRLSLGLRHRPQLAGVVKKNLRY